MKNGFAVLGLAFAVSGSAFALDARDEGVYALVHKDGHVTQTIARLSFAGGRWRMENRQPDGSWVDVTCDDGCELRKSTPEEVTGFLRGTTLEGVGMECVHDKAFAFCRSGSDERAYHMLAFTEEAVVPLPFVRLDADTLTPPASSRWKAEGQPVADTEWRKSSGDFGAMLLVTDDPEGFFDAWNKPASPDYTPTIRTTSDVRRGDRVAGVVVFNGCATDEFGNWYSDMDLRLLYPDGSVYGEFKGVEVWVDKPAPPSGNLQISVGNLGLKIEPDDPLGTYRFEAVVRDRVAGREVRLVQTVEVVETPGDGRRDPD